MNSTDFFPVTKLDCSLSNLRGNSSAAKDTELSNRFFTSVAAEKCLGGKNYGSIDILFLS